jgi:hypothetical protein
MDQIGFYYPGSRSPLRIGHLERPERVEAIKSALIKAGYWDEEKLVHSIAPPKEV